MEYIMNHPYISAAAALAVFVLLKGGKAKSRGPTVAVVPMRGVIDDDGPICLDKMKKSLDDAFDVTDVKAVAIQLNSPGGSPFYSEELHAYIRMKAQEKSVPVYVFIEEVGASGGYYIACAGDHVYASKHSIVGSIGVIARTFGLKGLAEKLGIERRVWKQGANKCGLDPFLPVEEGEVRRLTGIQAKVHEEFIRVVKERRGAAIDCEQNPDLFTGAVWAGEEAKELGLVDEIGTCVAVMREKFGKDVQFVKTKPKVGFLRSLFEDFGGIDMLCSRRGGRAQVRAEF
jgi:signal peptide peptidase SppA